MILVTMIIYMKHTSSFDTKDICISLTRQMVLSFHLGLYLLLETTINYI